MGGPFALSDLIQPLRNHTLHAAEGFQIRYGVFRRRPSFINSYCREYREDFNRILEHLNNFDVADPTACIDDIVRDVSVFEHNPLIGRPTRHDLRELVIGREAHGHIGLYRYVPEPDIVFHLAIRRQREAGYLRLWPSAVVICGQCATAMPFAPRQRSAAPARRDHPEYWRSMQAGCRLQSFANRRTQT